MKISTDRYFKLIQALLAIFMVTNLYADYVAGHGEVAVFRAKKQAEINAKKVQLKTQLNVVGALGVLDDELTGKQLDPVTFSRLVLGMMIGNGYRDGVTSGLKASQPERTIIERIVKRAAAHARNLNFVKDQVCKTNTTDAAVETHTKILNGWKAVIEAEPHFDYAPRSAETYKNLDQVINEICASFSGTPSQAMIQCAQLLSRNPDHEASVKNFLLCFFALSPEDKKEIISIYNDDISAAATWGGTDQDTLLMVANECNNTFKAKQFIQDRTRQKIFDRIVPLINLIPSYPQLKNLSEDTGSSLQQRNAIRAVLNYIASLNDQKEMCLDALFSRRLNSLIPPAEKLIKPNIQVLIDKIDIQPVIIDKMAIMKVLDLNISAVIKNCILAIANLSDVAMDLHYRALIEKIRKMAPIFNIARTSNETENEFKERKKNISTFYNIKHNSLISSLIQNRIAAITPPKELLNPAPVVANLLEAIDAATTLSNVGMYESNGDSFANRLINFLIGHWATDYKPETLKVTPAVMQPFKNELQARFGNIAGEYGTTATEKKKKKTMLVEKIMHGFIKNPPQTVQALMQCVPAAGALQGLLAAPVGVYTNMEKIKELPSVDWDGVLEKHVFRKYPDLRKNPAESDADYWDRIGYHVIENIYKIKIKPHIYPEGLLINLNRNVAPQLAAFSIMFSDTHDAVYGIVIDAFEASPEAIATNGWHLKQEHKEGILDFVNTGATLVRKFPQFKIDLNNSYKRVNDYIIKSLVDLFGVKKRERVNNMLRRIPKNSWQPDNYEDYPIESGLSWSFYGSSASFDQQRMELCKRVLLIFAYFDRTGAKFDIDMPDIAMLAGRFTHCADGKKDGINTVSERALCALTGVEGNLVDADFDSQLKLVIFNSLKRNAVMELADHPAYSENVSLSLAIKYRNQAFWNIQTPAEGVQGTKYSNSDYDLGDDNATDLFMRYFYQHIYVGPHELVNKIYRYLLSVTPKDRKNFIGRVSEMLAHHRPFKDMADETVDYTELVKERYCERILPASADYTLSRKGIEMILFYAGYLAWNGPAPAHPLIADWNASLLWLHTNHQEEYEEIYGKRVVR